MKVSAGAIVIGFTGPFGSGCTTATKHVRDRGYERVSLSDALKNEAKAAGIDVQSRHELQAFGDQLRMDNAPGILVDLAFRESSGDEDEHARVVVDSIRNTGEVEALRERFGYRFSLIAVPAASDARWMRIESQYTDVGLSREDFVDDDQRDENEEVPWGQEVSLCVDMADILIDNSGNVTLEAYKEKVKEFADLVTGVTKRHAKGDEIAMHMAFSSARTSKCLKRNVGAVIVDDRGEIVGVGYNENPAGTAPCVEEDAYSRSCFRDILRNAHFERLANEGARCPKCGEGLPRIEGPPWRCPSCLERGMKTNLESYFFPDRAMNWCTALHAEERAILSAGSQAARGRLYTTTFPCFLCSEKLINSGIQRIYFTEAYPDQQSADRLDIAGVEYQQFEGVRSSGAFERLFPRAK
jgi:deoxycytidylate deaminase/dephospho-CoA kinase